MPVWVSTDPTEDVGPNSKQRRHITKDCPTYKANVPKKHRSPAKGKPNTEKLQARTARCEDPACWEKREREDAARLVVTQSVSIQAAGGIAKDVQTLAEDYERALELLDQFCDRFYWIKDHEDFQEEVREFLLDRGCAPRAYLDGKLLTLSTTA